MCSDIHGLNLTCIHLNRKVRLGVLEREAEAQEFAVDAMFVHTDYYFDQHDLALLRLAKRVHYSGNTLDSIEIYH